jgi:Domain of unknown function (DUF4262)
MCWLCDHPEATLDDYLDLLREQMRRNGWAIQYVEGRTPFAYTIGLHDCGLPELLVSGISPQRAKRLLNAVARDAMRGRTLTPGEQITLPRGPVIEIVQVDHPDAHMNWAVAFGGPKIRAMQLVWADGRGRWPWAPGFCDDRTRQPVLGFRCRAA